MHLTAQQLLVPFVAAIVAGALNSAAGGGSFISFPAMLLVGFPPILANATNNTAMWIGNIGSIGGFREDFELKRADAIPPIVVCVAGGAIGSILLLETPESAFERAIPWLLAFATIVFAAGPWLRRGTDGTKRGVGSSLATLVPLFLVTIYGGYFGAGTGIMILALFAATTAMTIIKVNALKNVLVFFVNGTAVIPFAFAHAVVWPEALAMGVGAIAGAYGGARVIRRLHASVVRGIVIAIGATMSIYFFVHR
jgi:uncharacterized membrane protein YfcA